MPKAVANKSPRSDGSVEPGVETPGKRPEVEASLRSGRQPSDFGLFAASLSTPWIDFQQGTRPLRGLNTPSSPAIVGFTPQVLCRRPLRRGLVSDLEHKPQAILYLAAVVGHEFRSDLAEVRAGEINRRISELNAIENIVRFNSGFQLEAFRQAK